MSRPIKLPMRPTASGLLARVDAAYTPEMRAFLAALPDKSRRRLIAESIVAAGSCANATDVERLVVMENDDDGDVTIASVL